MFEFLTFYLVITFQPFQLHPSFFGVFVIHDWEKILLARQADPLLADNIGL